MSFLFGRADSSSAANSAMASNDIQIRTPEEAGKTPNHKMPCPRAQNTADSIPLLLLLL